MTKTSAATRAPEWVYYVRTYDERKYTRPMLAETGPMSDPDRAHQIQDRKNFESPVGVHAYVESRIWANYPAWPPVA